MARQRQRRPHGPPLEPRLRSTDPPVHRSLGRSRERGLQQWLASGSDDNTVRLWNPASGQQISQFSGHSDSVRSVAFSHDGQWLASGSDDNTVRIWSVETGELTLTLYPTAEGWAAFTPDGRYKTLGNLAGGLWFAIGLCRFEPGELDPYLPSVRAVPLDEPF